MTRLNIGTGIEGNTSTGDTIRTAMAKVNTNFEELYQLVGDADTGLITTTLTNGDLKLQPNGTGTIEIDKLKIDSSAITTIETNANLTLTANGTGAITLDSIKVMMPNLPTSNPGVAGQLWRDGTDLKISTG